MSFDALKDKLRDVDTREVFVWRGGFKDWKRVEDVAELTPPRPQEPPPFRAEAHKRKPIPSNKSSSVRVSATLAGGAAAVPALVLAVIGWSFLKAFGPFPQWSPNVNGVIGFVIGFAYWICSLALVSAAYHGTKQYVERKRSEAQRPAAQHEAEEDWGQRLAEIADEKRKLSDAGENRFSSQPRKSEEPPTPRAPRSRWGLIAIPILGVVVGLSYELLSAVGLPECNSVSAKYALADVLKQEKLEPTRYEPITTVSSSKTQVVCKATLPLPDGDNVAIDYSFFWQGSQAHIQYSIHRDWHGYPDDRGVVLPDGTDAHGANTEKRLCHAIDGSTVPCPW
jgi:hypothetical protein